MGVGTFPLMITILNACQSGKQMGASETSLGSRLMQAGVQLVLAMGYSVTVSAAELLMKTLYQHLFAGNDLSVAIRHARTELYNNKERKAFFDQIIDLEDWLLPVLYQNHAQHLTVRDFTAEEAEIYYRRQSTRYMPPQPSYGFVGRDLDILHIEKRLLIERCHTECCVTGTWQKSPETTSGLVLAPSRCTSLHNIRYGTCSLPGSVNKKTITFLYCRVNSDCGDLIGNQRTRKTFGETVKGIITAGSLICQQIAAPSAEVSKGKKGLQRVIRLATR